MLDVKFKLVASHTSERSWMDPSPLRKLFWNVTYACNYRCPVCFTDAAGRRRDELGTAEAAALVKHARAAGVEDIIVSGGEPFCRDDMVEILAAMAGEGITARIASNGSMLSDELLARLRDETLTKSFQISLDTLDPALYSRLHGVPGDRLADALSALRRIRNHGFHTTVSTRLTPDTLPEIPVLLDRAADEGWATVTVHWPVHSGRTQGAFAQDADLFALLEPALAHFASMPRRWMVETYIAWAPYHPVVERFAHDLRFVHCGCRAARDRLTIHPCGQIGVCVCLDTPAAYVGNVRTHNLADVYENAPLCLMMRHPQEHGICAACPNVAVCGGGCRAAAFAVTGRMDGEDPCCPVRKAAKG